VEQIISLVEVFAGVRETVETYHGTDDTLITAALPGVDLNAGVRLLPHLTSCDVDLAPAAVNDLIWGVKNTGRP
jgi:hypothetical protein